MKMTRVIVWCVVIGCLVALMGYAAFADELATISGRITDPHGLVVAGVKIDATNINTNLTYSGETNADGLYRIPNIPPGPYRVIVQKTGFAQILKPDVDLHVQDLITLNFTMQLGSVSERITVEGGAPLVNTESAAVSTVVDQTYVKNMPLNGRSFQDLILLTPGVVTQTPQNILTGLGQTGEFSVNGQRSESNYYTVDGVSANLGAATGSNMAAGAGASGSVAASTALGTTQALVSVDALQEFRVQSSTYSAEYGRNPGGQLALETKSGTNQWHGTAYDYLRNNYFDANDWFTNYFSTKGAALRQNDFGGTLGAPVRIPGLYNGKDKTFFFFSYEGLRLTAPQPSSANFVPDLCMRGTGPCPTSGPGAGRAPAAGPLLPVVNAFPVPTNTGKEINDPANGVSQFIGSWSNPGSLDSTSVRFDHAINDKLRLFFRFSDTASSSATRGTSAAFTSPTTNTISSQSMRTYTAGASEIFTSRLSDEFRLNYSSNETTSRSVIDPLGGSTRLDMSQLPGLGPSSAPILFFTPGPYFFQIFQAANSGTQRQWNLVGTVNISVGRHQLKFGADYRRLAPFEVPNSPQVSWFYLDTASIQGNNGFAFGSNSAAGYPLYTNFSLFVQDAWKLSSRLNLSMGLRWEVNPAPGVTQGLNAYTVQGSTPDTWTLAPQGTALWKTTWYNFAPRLGVAYILHNTPGWETVVRGGSGVFFDTGQQLGSTGFNGPGFASISPFGPGMFPVVPIIPAIVNPPTPPFAGDVFGFSPHLQLPYTLHWNASFEQALGKSEALSASYIASHSGRLLQANLFKSAVNPILAGGQFFIGQNRLTSDYDSLQIQFRRRLSQGLTALGSYTWSHCVDYGSQNYLLGYQRGNCDFDVRHNFSGAVSYDLPNVGRNGFVNALLRHWGLDDRFMARTAFPVTLTGNNLIQPDGRVYDEGLSLVPGQPVYLYGANCATVLQGLGDLRSGQGCPGGRAINPNAFMNISSGLGTAPRNFARGFGAWQMNMAVRREFPICENLKVQFRAEAFNVFNHPNFGVVNPNCIGTPGVPGCTNPQFGQATATLANSLGVLNSLYQMGSPRSMQFALKLVF